MGLVATVCGASLRFVWEVTIARCFVTNRQRQEKKSATAALLKAELAEKRRILEELRATMAERDASLEKYRRDLSQVKLRIVESQRETNFLKMCVKEKEMQIENLKENHSVMERELREIVTNPCRCFLARHLEQYLYETYKSDTDSFHDLSPILTCVADTSEFSSEDSSKIQLSEYESPDDATSSRFSDSSANDIRFINEEGGSSASFKRS